MGYCDRYRLAYQRRLQLPLLVHQLGNRHCNNHRSEADQSSRSGATRKGIEIVRQQRKDAARLAGDHIAYMHWDSVSCDELAAGMTDEEQAIVFELVAKAEVKHDTKQLPPGIIKRLRERQERNLVDDDWYFRALRLKVTVVSLWKVA